MLRKLTNLEISKKRFNLETIKDVEKIPVYLILDNIRSMYNVGSIFRTSDAYMIEKIFLTGFTPTPEKKEVLKTALGATESVVWEYAKDPVKIIEQLKSKNIKIVALEITEKSINLSEIKRDFFPLCLIVGNEISGVQSRLLELCDYSLELEMYGTKHSLNVAVAYGIAIKGLRDKYSQKY